MERLLWLTVAAGLVLSGVLVLLRKQSSSIAQGEPTQTSSELSLFTDSGRLRVLRAHELFQLPDIQRLINRIRHQSRCIDRDFPTIYLPVIEAFAEFVQLLPASESHHHAEPGGLLKHTLEVAAFALEKRQGKLLPPGAAPEDQHALEHRWTYGVFVGALLHDIAKAMCDLDIVAYVDNEKETTVWNPMTGSLVQLNARSYELSFPTRERDYLSHQRLGVSLFQLCVPQPTVAWIGRDPNLLSELYDLLSNPDNKGVLKELIQYGDMTSVRQNLLSGSRQRFAAARRTPLIEKLMEALRQMLSDKGRLPLNRPGAAGWVFDGSIWFVSKRIADEVREYLVTNNDADGIPGPDKNDRLFDCWQEYGAIIPNPNTGGAIWSIHIHGSAYKPQEKPMTVLRFPLSKLFYSADSYPPAMEGRLELANREPQIVKAGDAIIDSHVEPLSVSTELPITAGHQIVEPTNNQIVQTAEKPEHADGEMSSFKSTETVAPEESYLSEEDSAALRPKQHQKAHDDTSKSSQMIQKPGINNSAIKSLKDLKPNKPNKAPVHEDSALSKVSPAILPEKYQNPTELVRSAANSKKEPSKAALRFMQWLQNGIQNGVIKYNESNATVHFVKEGMLLVSPSIFKHYVETIGDDPDSLAIKLDPDKPDSLWYLVQRQVCAAGWHQKAPRNENIITYQVIRQSGQGGNLLRGLLVPEPERFFTWVPQPNARLAKLAIPTVVSSDLESA